jgi:hypothetical protein
MYIYKTNNHNEESCTTQADYFIGPKKGCFKFFYFTHFLSFLFLKRKIEGENF